MLFRKVVLYLGFFFCVSAQAGFWKEMWGSPAPSALTFAPVGYHIFDGLRGTPQPNDFNWMTAVNYHSFIVGTFNNSEKRQVYFAGMDRNFYTYKKLTLGYLLAIMHGYHGSLENDLGPIFGHDPGPLLALTVHYQLSPHFDLFSSYYGMGLLFGTTYRF